MMKTDQAKGPTWQRLISQSLVTPEALEDRFEMGGNGLREVTARYPMRINPYYLSLIREKGDAIYRQCVPDVQEISDQKGAPDPLNEEGLSPVPGITHKYPDRVMFLVSSSCAVYCRFCNRKRVVGSPSMVSGKSIQQGLSYIRSHPEVRDVLLSGGDPLLLQDDQIESLLRDLRSIPHVEIIRIGTRVPCTLPQRITPPLARLLKRYHPLYINTHFNHPREVTIQAAAACRRLADAGVPLGCQTVLLKGVNDDPVVIKQLMQRLLILRVRPFYLFQADLVKGTSHFWTPLSKGLEIMQGLQGYTSGLCVPHFAVDLPGGGGKVPLLPEYVTRVEPDALWIRNYRGEEFRYPLVKD